MPFAGVSSVAVRSEMKHGSSQRHVVLTLNRHYARVDDQESINCQTMTPDTFVRSLRFFTRLVDSTETRNHSLSAPGHRVLVAKGRPVHFGSNSTSNKL